MVKYGYFIHFVLNIVIYKFIISLTRQGTRVNFTAQIVFVFNKFTVEHVGLSTALYT